MKISISGITLLSEIQQSFHSQFSMLSLAFFKRSHAAGEANTKSDKLNNALSVSETSGINVSVSFEFTPAMTVGEFEKQMEDFLNLHTQVLRKSGDVWLQTTNSDQKTLQEIQDEMLAAEGFRVTDEEPIDIHEQE